MYRTGYRPSGWRIGVFFSCSLVCLSPLFSTAQAALPFDNRNLVGRDGKVISTHARGRELGRLLEEQFPSKPAAE